MAAGNTIVVNPASGIRYKEGIAAGTIKPGYFIKETVVEVDPNPPTVNVHSTAGGGGILQIAVEDSLQGVGIDTNYTTGNPVRSFVPRSGDRFLGWLKDGEVGVFGSTLSSNGDGTFQVSSGTEVVLAVLRKAGSPSGSDSLLLMEAV